MSIYSESSNTSLIDSLDRPFKPTVPPPPLPSPEPPLIFPKNPSPADDTFYQIGGPATPIPSVRLSRLKQDFVTGIALLGAMVPILAIVLGFALSASSEPDTKSLVRSASRNGGGIPTFSISSNLSQWVDQENAVAFTGILANIGPGCGADDGIIIASPSMGVYEDQPDYYYTWTRDASLVISSLLPHFLPIPYLRPWTYTNSPNLTANPSDSLLEPLLRAFVASQEDLQVINDPSGDLWTGGLNEPKYMVDKTAFTGPWGRPQRDGPALRALALIPYAHYLLDRAYPVDLSYVRQHLYDPTQLRVKGSVIKNDLEEVGGGWWEDSFDLWEEVNGQHLFTQLACLRALQAGANLANRLKDPGAATYYIAQADKLITHLKTFWDEDQGIWKATITSTPDPEAKRTATAQELLIGARQKKQRTGLDCALPLSIIHGGGNFTSPLDPDSGDNNGPFGLNPTDPEVLASLREYVLSFEGLYGINEGRNWTDGWALGRYAEDIYNGVGTSKGNPWYICTFSLSQVLYQTLQQYLQQKTISLHPLSIPFWTDVLGPDNKHLLPSLSVSEESFAEWNWNEGTPGDLRYETAITRLGEVAEAYLDVGRRYSEPQKGRMTEQIDRLDGSPTGARDLTWSYAAFLEVSRTRSEVVDEDQAF